MAAVRLTNEKLTELKEAFMLFDYDKDGKVDSRDVGPVIRSVGLKPSEAEIREIREEIDGAGGEVDLQTLVTLVSRTVTNPAQERPEDLKEMFRMYDKEGKGYISATEMRHLLTSIGEKFTDDEADDLLKICGCVDRGNVNYDKFVQVIMRG